MLISFPWFNARRSLNPEQVLSGSLIISMDGLNPTEYDIFVTELVQWLETERRRKQETGSIVADPQFADADNYDFRIADSSPAIARIGFEPFDPSKAGLVGDKEWTSLPARIKRPEMKFWSQRSRELKVHGEGARWRAGFTP